MKEVGILLKVINKKQLISAACAHRITVLTFNHIVQHNSKMASSIYHIIFIFLFHQIHLYTLTSGHGRLLEPPARNTLWRFGFKAPANYNDNELFCGGIGGIVRNEGKCGICGDPYDGVRSHETGNSMALNETTRNYFPGSTIDLMIEIVANHGGRFNFEMCWRNNWTTVETEDCFEPLLLSGSSKNDNETREENNINDNEEKEEEVDGETYELDLNGGTGFYTMSVDLPANRTCENCILRWHWTSANNWGVCEDGTEAVGCGYQEIYRNCADISVKRNGAGIGLGLNSRRRRR